MMPYNCHICFSECTEFDIKDLRGVSSDCRPCNGVSNLAVCTSCGQVQRIADQTFFDECQKIYESYAVYFQGQGAEQKVFDQHVMINRSQKVINGIKDLLPISARGKLLDIGCGNGNFLKTFGKFYPQWQLYGMEQNELYRDEVLAINGVEKFFIAGQELIKDKFDLVVLFHTLEHIYRPVEWLKNISLLLTENGMLLIQVPSWQENPFDLMIVDHCSFFSFTTLKNLLYRAGLGNLYLAQSFVAKELAIVAGKGSTTIIFENQNSGGKLLHSRIEWLRKLKQQATNSLSGTVDCGIFGSSIAASWLYANIDTTMISYFLDEDNSRIGQTMLGKPIISPLELPYQGTVFIPFPNKISEVVVQRMKQIRPDIKWLTPATALQG